MGQYIIRQIDKKDYSAVEKNLKDVWGSIRVVSRGILYDASRLPGFIAEAGNNAIGLITNNIDHRGCEIVTLNSLCEKAGIGSGLIEKVKKEAYRNNCRRLWLITTNDNLKAVEYYKHRGFRIAAIYKEAIAESRKLKPEIPLYGIDGVPITDEIEMEIQLRE